MAAEEAAAGDERRPRGDAATVRAAVVPRPPPGYRNQGAWVEHLVAPRRGRVSELAAEALGLPQVSARVLRPPTPPTPTLHAHTPSTHTHPPTRPTHPPTNPPARPPARSRPRT